jgi:CPA1 family monovalent cation:H+ antiporter
LLATVTPLFEISTVLLLLCLVTLLAFATRKWMVPYPTILVIVGALLALVPGLPDIQLTPDVVFLIFLPPLLYSAAWQTNFQEFYHHLRPIAFLALGLVVATTLVVGSVCKWLVPEMSWPVAFALGAIISPPDAVAATAVTNKLRVPKRIVVILEGESLLNDASGLVAYRVALAVAAGEVFSWTGTLVSFVLVAAGGLLLGAVVGWLAIRIHERLDEPVVETVFTLLTPYAAYIAAEAFHLSGVLACVCSGLLVRAYGAELFSAATRLHASAVWESVVFVLTGLTFIFIGLGLRGVLVSIADESLLVQSIMLSTVVLGVTILVRIACVLPLAWTPAFVLQGRKEWKPIPFRYLLLIGWTGMRGVVSLAAALALPADFPHRNLIFVTVIGVIFGTLIIQGVSLPFVVKWLRLPKEGRPAPDQEVDARLLLLAEANLFLNARRDAGVPESEIEYLQNHFHSQAEAWLSRLAFNASDELIENQSRRCQDTYLQVLRRQRKRLHQMARDSIVEERVVQKIERELDMEETRLTSVTAADAN